MITIKNIICIIFGIFLIIIGIYGIVTIKETTGSQSIDENCILQRVLSAISITIGCVIIVNSLIDNSLYNMFGINRIRGPPQIGIGGVFRSPIRYNRVQNDDENI